MTRGRDNAAENISDVIELIRKRRQSGLLSIECIQGGLFEEGEIYFRDGQPVYARQGQLSNADALTRLLSWQRVYFAFIPDQTQPAAQLPSAIGTRTNAAVATDPGVQSVNRVRSTSNNTVFADSRSPSAFPGKNARRTFPTTATTPGLEWLVPRKIGNDRNVLSLPLTRPQRSIYLLIDGKRTVSDLSRCTRRSLQEIERLLSELQQRGLISM